MTSCGICPSCQGEVILYENPVEFGKYHYMTFSGTCPNCGLGLTEYPKGVDPYEIEEMMQLETDRKHVKQRVDEADAIGDFDAWIKAKRNYDDYPPFIAHGETEVQRYSDSFKYIDEAIGYGDAAFPEGHKYTISRSARAYSGRAIYVNDTEYTAEHRRYALSWQYFTRYGYSDDGRWTDHEVAVQTIEDVRRILERYKWRDDFSFTLTDNDAGTVMFERGRREDMEGLA